ncbi:MAG: hypothetical protein VYA60_08015 [Pseudomonadota bacterium]|nr:hypothetical protein [Pseudomonadota bacterium]
MGLNVNINNELGASVNEVIDYLKYVAELDSRFPRTMIEPEVSNGSKCYALMFNANLVELMEVINLPDENLNSEQRKYIDDIFNENSEYFYSLAADIAARQNNTCWKSAITSVFNNACTGIIDQYLTENSKSVEDKLDHISLIRELEKIINSNIIGNTETTVFLKISLMKYVIENVDKEFFNKVIAPYYPEPYY